MSHRTPSLPFLALFLAGKGWIVGVSGIAFLVALPILAILKSIFANTGETWRHLASTVLGDYIFNSLLLMAGVGIGVLAIGVGTAWLVTACRFWGDRFFEWGLLLPLAAPAYLLAYTYTSMLDYFGPVQVFLRSLFGWQGVEDYWFPNVRSLWGAILMLVLVLYPYVYLLARVAFLEQSLCTLEASRSLGCNPWQSFYRVALPLARPAIMAGLALALMEALNDFGTVQYFGVNTFTTGIYSTWFGMGDRVVAAQLAACLMAFVLLSILLEMRSRARASYHATLSAFQHLPRYQLSGLRAMGAILACGLPILLGLLVPGLYLSQMAIGVGPGALDSDFWQLANHSFILAIASAVVALVFSLVMGYGQRLYRNRLMRGAVRFAAMGYAIPGSVIAVGILMPMGQLDNWIDGAMRSLFGIATGLLISGTAIALIYAYLVRFLAVGFGVIESSLLKIRPSLDDAAHSLGYGPTRTLWKVHIPLLSGGMLTAMMLVFVDVMKELSATLVIRPFNFDTLAVRVYQYASDERLHDAAAPALAIVLVGLLPVIFLSWQISRSRLRLD
jgi:iron(III) transport system permease protein